MKLALHALDEVAHHGGEIGLLRDLYLQPGPICAGATGLGAFPGRALQCSFLDPWFGAGRLGPVTGCRTGRDEDRQASAANECSLGQSFGQAVVQDEGRHSLIGRRWRGACDLTFPPLLLGTFPSAKKVLLDLFKSNDHFGVHLQHRASDAGFLERGVLPSQCDRVPSRP
ncbi:hypothetical protein ACGFN1_16930 [Streptomyces sp. NPDC048685]|uniref:hypothetical protein n=1 Tax=Streptomyces sp. NPDC048685 TaxID=3365584 RepID=UPI0037240D22